MILVYLLLIIQSDLFSQQWKPDVSTLEGQVQVVGSIVKRHPDFIKQNVRFKNNPLNVLRPVDQIVKDLGDKASNLSFGNIRTVSSNYTSEGELTYDQEKIQTLKKELQESLRNLKRVTGPFVFTSIKADIINIAKYDTRAIKNYLKLLPFFYNGEGLPLFQDLSGANLDPILEEIDQSSSEEIHEYYGDLIKHQLEILEDLNDKKIEASLNSFKNNYLSHRNKVLSEATTPVGKDGTSLKRRTISLEELPTLVALFRAEFAWDCATTEVPYYPLIKETRTYAIRKSSSLTDSPVGYLFMSLVDFEGKKIPYIITIGGETLTNVDEKEAVYLIGKIWNTEQVLFANFGPTIFMIREGVFEKTKNVTVSMPSGWDLIDKIKPKSKYDSEILKKAKLVSLYRTPKAHIEVISTPYRKQKKISDFSIKDRAALAVYCLEDYKNDRTGIENIFQISPEQLAIARAIIEASPEKPINTDLLKRAKEVLGFEFKDILHLDLLVKTHSLSLLYKETPEITSIQEWGKVFKNINIKIDIELDKTEDTGKRRSLIKAKITTPIRYWEEYIVSELLNNEDINQKVLILNLLKEKEASEKILKAINDLIDLTDPKIKKAIIELLSSNNLSSLNILEKLTKYLQSNNEERILYSLEILQTQKVWFHIAWQSMAELIKKEGTSPKILTTIVETIKTREYIDEVFFNELPEKTYDPEIVSLISSRKREQAKRAQKPEKEKKKPTEQNLYDTRTLKISKIMDKRFPIVETSMEYNFSGNNYDVEAKIYKNGTVMIVSSPDDKIDFDLKVIPEEVINSLFLEHRKGKQLVDILNIKNAIQNNSFLQKIDYESDRTTLIGNYFILVTMTDEEQQQIQDILINTIPVEERALLLEDENFKLVLQNIYETKEARSKLLNYTALKYGSNTHIVQKAWEIMEEELNVNRGRLSQKTLALLSYPDVIELMDTVANFSSNKALYGNMMLEVTHLIEKIANDVSAASYYTGILERRLSDIRKVRELIKK